MAAYIDLNSVRAGLARDPKDYRFCGYAEAVAGSDQARQGICSVLNEPDWDKAQAGYRQTLFGIGDSPREHAASTAPGDFARVLKDGGKLPLATVLRCRVRYFSDGAVLGSRAFVETHLAAHRKRTGRLARTAPRSLPSITDWGAISSLRGLRRDVFG